MSVDSKQVTLLDHGDGDEPQINMAPNPTFAAVLQARLGRRELVKGSMGAAALGFLGTSLTGCLSSGSSSSSDPAPAPAALIGFNAVSSSEADDIIVPEGYSYHVLGAWGEPILGSMPAFSVNNTGADQAQQIGSHHDGMHFFPIEGESPYEGSSEDGLLVVNHEYVEPRFMHQDSIGQPLNSGAVRLYGAENDQYRPTDEVLKEMNAHGISVYRIRKQINNEWQIQQDSRNRRITALTPMEIQGPVRGSAFVQTLYSPNGTMTRGTLNNCAHGVTPWNTYMFSEENWAGYFVNGGSNSRDTAQYGVRASGRGRYGWELAQSGEDQYIRFDASIKADDATGDYRNEPHCFGWMVEVDPFDPDSVPKKRTALGRFAHEGVVFAPAVEGQPVVCYSGDDARYQYIYKYVSHDNYFASTANGSLLDNGILYVAKFNADGTGEWLPLVYGQNGLTPANGYTSQADVLINTRDAATLVGATRMDRPEWGAVDPNNGDVYFALTNNTSRTEAEIDEANPRASNSHGQIVRWAEANNEQAAVSFEWDLFLLAGDGGESGNANFIGRDMNGNVLTEDAYMSSPDGLWIDKDSRIWIQTDVGEGSQNRNQFAIMGNNCMFAANPETGEIRRFLTGPIGQEITGCITTPDQRTLFINVQHPGATTAADEWANGTVRSTWPFGTNPPRSATVVIWKDDGGVIGT
ncbi:PhoX family protein [Halopseudomonas salegens]|uniref:Tat pathway signal protein n=1 Tax=Halopseudomonas salegens TaxID=1434072 RepID=A0A1H2GC74_9GAMM|nr:PhoX family phosphatase [Halopseudomonas salegens]SDU17099.1 hypothetical protein SAMN05216210_2192 [Halopseudomonas salegens]